MKEVWPLVRPGLEAVVRKTNPTWIPEDVYSILQQKRGHLVMGFERGAYAGFVVMSYEADQFTGGSIPMVWIAFAKPGTAPETLEFVLEAVEDQTRKQGFHQLIMHSPRPGWRKLAPKLGFKIRDCVWAKEL